MNPSTQTAAALFSALKGGQICDFQELEDGLQFRIHLPEKAEKRVEGSAYFLCKLTNVKTFALQPFRNASTTIESLVQIQQLGLKIDSAAAAEGGLVKVWCRMGDGSADARLGIVAVQFQVWDEAFDQVNASDLA